MSDDARADADAPVAPTAPAPAAAPSTGVPASKSERVRAAFVVPDPTGPGAPGVPAFVAAVHARDAAAVRASLSPTFHGKANGRPMDGDAQVRLLESFWTGFPDGNFTMEPTGGSGRYVITWTFQGTHGGMYVGVPPTGIPVALSGFIVAVADRTGVTALDWKWDTKVFTRAVLGPDDVGDLEVKDTFRDPSRRWQNDGRGQGRGPGQGKRKKGKGRPGQQQGGRPQGPRSPQGGQPGEGAQPGAPADGAPTGQPGQQGQGQRQRRPKKPREPRPDQPATPDHPASADSATSAAPPAPAAGEPSAQSGPKPDAT